MTPATPPSRTCIRVAHVIGALTYGGVETTALHIIRGVGDEFESRTYFIGTDITERAAEFEQASTAFIHCPYVPPRRLDFVRRLAARFRADQIDAVLCYSFGNHAMVSAAGWLGGARRRFVTVQGSPARDATTLRKSRILANLARPFCNGEIAASEQVRDELVRAVGLPASRVSVIENSCPVSEFRDRARTGRSKRTDPTKTVVMVARMDDAKDQATLIRAVAILLGRGEKLCLKLCGDGPNRSSLEALAAEQGIGANVEFLGARRDVPEVLGASDVAVLSTHTEGFGIVLAEAMATETPVIATDLPITREVLEDGRCGTLVRPRDPAAMADAIANVLARPDTAAVQRAYERASQKYDAKNMAMRYGSLLSGKGVS